MSRRTGCLLAALVVVFSGCKRDPMTDSGAAATDSGPPPDPCAIECPVDSTVVGPFDFATQIQTIFNASCSNGPCHSGGTMGGTLNLTTGNTCTTAVGVVAEGTSTTTMMPRITPGDADASYMIHKLMGDHACATVGGTGDRMPFGDACLAPATIGTIRAWIEDGANCN